MKVFLASSMPTRIANATAQINSHFATLAAQQAVIDAVHIRKHEIATSVKGGGVAPDAFAQEAALRDITVDQLAALVLSKPCPTAAADERELRRQTLLLAVAAAKTPADIEAAMASLGS